MSAVCQPCAAAQKDDEQDTTLGVTRQGHDRQPLSCNELQFPLLAKTADGNDHIKRLTGSLELLLQATVADTSLAYFREFLARESLRQPAEHPST
jgi:hypothetical protein